MRLNNVKSTLTPCPVPDSGILGNHDRAASVPKSMTPRAIPGGCVTRLLPSCLILLSLSLPQALPAADRITAAIDNSERVTLSGHLNPRIASAVDQGPVDSSMALPYITLMLKPSASQQADLEQFLVQQQDASSTDYHNWLTPEQYAERFGVSQPDLDKIVAWLGNYGLTVKSVARGRNAIAFGGTAGQVGSAFGVAIHRYQVKGVQHYANSTDPTIPAALQSVVLGVRGLHDFRWKPKLLPNVHRRDTQDGAYYLSPADVATIYNTTPLYSAGINGAGHNLVVVGQTDIIMSDIEFFRTYFSLPTNDPTVIMVPDSPDPGVQINSGDLAETDLDLELSGSVAPNATILFVTSNDVETSLQYAIEENLAPIISTSYGDCELDTGKPGALMLQSLAMQANAQGQSLFAAAGDAGAADCFGDGDGPAIDDAASVDLPASLPQVTGVGGTEFNEGNNPGTYWNTNNTSTHESAKSYIPEIVWNDSTESIQQGYGPSATGGGKSVFFSKPSWQTGSGVPNDGARDVPDVAISASNFNDVYEIYSDGSFSGYGGTSVGAPQFAGIATLLSQYLVSNGIQSSPPLGNINPTLYQLGSVGGVFHDITSGNNTVIPCENPCTTAATQGYSAGPGYDQVTGWGTPDIYNLITAWHGHSVASPLSVTMKLAASPTRVAFTDTTVLTATVTSANGGTPTGTVTFSEGTSTLGTATLTGSGASATATLTLNGVLLAVGPNTITASYSGNTTYYGESASVTLVETTPSNGLPTISTGGAVNAASDTAAVAAGGILSVYGTQLAPILAGAQGAPLPTMLAGTTATINGYPAPLYFVSPTQLNIQIPYEVSSGSGSTLASLTITNNGNSATNSFYVAAAAPAIFTTNSAGTGQGSILNNSTYQLVDASHPATPGSTYIQIYCTGLGAVSNQPADGGVSPSSPLAQTAVPAQVTIGGVTENAVFSGLAPGFVGLYQVNALVPAGVKAGNAVEVGISIGGAVSNTVTIAVQ